ncbi:MAG: hypothetical protein ACMXYL_00080 [Candidatus Woesearchaeota archaeon]
MMRYIRNNVNILLLLIIIVMAVTMIGYNNYQDNLTRDIMEENKEMRRELTELKDDLGMKEDRLRETFSELQRQLQDSIRFESLYTDIASERESLNSSLSEMTARWQDEQSRRRELEVRATSLENQLNSRTIELQVAEGALGGCMASLTACRAQLDN